MLMRAVEFSHQLLKEIAKPGDIFVDGTMGNGHDTLFLRQLVGQTGEVFAFDIQEAALESTKKRLEEAKLDDKNVHLILDSHAHIKNHLQKPIKGAIFNLGYLPTGDKKIITKKESTLSSLEALLPLLEHKGRLVIVLYYGHPGGKEEKDAVLAFSSQLDQTVFTVASYQFLNQVHQPPILLVIEKR